MHGSFCKWHLEEERREGNQSLFWNSPRCRLPSHESGSLMKCRELMGPVTQSVNTLCLRGQALRKMTTAIKKGTKNKVPRLSRPLGDILLSGVNSLSKHRNVFMKGCFYLFFYLNCFIFQTIKSQVKVPNYFTVTSDAVYIPRVWED